jgi:hypothetical protein
MKIEKLVAGMGYGLAALLTLSSCAASPDQISSSDERSETDEVGMQQAPAESDWIAAIDAEQPSRIETATFALG